MLEIYNEQVRDLLQKNNPKGGLPVRQNPKEGVFFVQGLRKTAVGSYKEIEKRIDEGRGKVYVTQLLNTNWVLFNCSEIEIGSFGVKMVIP